MMQQTRNRMWTVCRMASAGRFGMIRLSLLVSTTLIAVGCNDPRMDVYEFIETQEQYEREQLGLPTNHEPVVKASKPAARVKSSGSKSSIARTATDGPTASAASTTAESGIIRNKEAVTYTGRWTYNSETQMWSFVREAPAKSNVVLASHRQTNQEPAESPVDGAGSGHDATEMPSDAPEDEASIASLRAEVYQQFHQAYRVGPGDVLKVTLTGLTGLESLAEPLDLSARVNRNGRINLPMAGSVHVGDLEIEDVEKAIINAYVPKYVNTIGVSAEMGEYATTDVVVVGAALLPGIVKLNRSQRDVLHAVVAAGGMTQEASGEIKLQRISDQGEKIALNVRRMRDLKAALLLEPLRSGDIVTVVAAQPNTIFVGGLVNSPGPKEFPQGTKINALQALAAGGGIVEAVMPTEATLIRRMPDGEDLFVRIDLEKTKQGADPNVELAAGDIFWVPETVGTRIMDFVNRTLFLRAGMTVTYNVTGVEFLNRRGLQGNRNGNNNVQNSVDPLGFLAN